MTWQDFSELHMYICFCIQLEGLKRLLEGLLVTYLLNGTGCQRDKSPVFVSIMFLTFFRKSSLFYIIGRGCGDEISLFSI